MARPDSVPPAPAVAAGSQLRSAPPTMPG